MQPSTRSANAKHAAAMALLLVLWAPGARALALQPGLSFTGQTFETAIGGFTIPPDTMGAVGRDHVVEMLNSGFAVYDKETGAPLVTKTLDAFWRDAGVNRFDTFDPRILYDPEVDRYFAVALDTPREANSLLVAVSESADPAGAWTGFAIDSHGPNTLWADFPMLGLDSEGVYVGAAMFPVGQSSGLPIANDVLVLPKADLVAPVPSIARATLFEAVSLQTSGFNPYPAVDLDGGAPPAKLYAGAAAFLGVVQVSRVDGPIDAPSFGAQGAIAVDPIGIPPGAVQPGTEQRLDPRFDTRFGNVVERGGSVWAVQSVAHPETGRAAIRWLEIDAETDIVLQTGIVGDAALDLIFPSIAVNELDQIVIGFTGSGESRYASSYAVLGERVGGATRFGELLLLQEGVAAWTLADGRFGDYSATVVDPEDPSVFWTFQEWVAGPENWAVQITQLRVVPEPGTWLLVSAGLAVLARTGRRPRR
jgi:hypothetical protein